MKIRKRDGRIKPFDFSRIENAIRYAAKDVELYKNVDNAYTLEPIFQDVSDEIKKLNKDIIDIEDIQDIVVDVLKQDDELIYKSYKDYRDNRTIERGSVIDKEISELLTGQSEYWNKENSNKNATLVTTQRDYLAGIVSKDMTRRKLLPKDVVELDKKGIIHFHDGDYFLQKSLHNC